MREFSILHQGRPAAKALPSQGFVTKGIKAWDGLP